MIQEPQNPDRHQHWFVQVGHMARARNDDFDGIGNVLVKRICGGLELVLIELADEHERWAYDLAQARERRRTDLELWVKE